tara:strand:+ start:103 stop:657 length:555 start_codon:yes stop_codon:yes gene_type:complete
MIHPSHSKKDLIEVIEMFELFGIVDYRDMTKDELQVAVWDYVRDIGYIKPDQEYFFVDDANALLKFLNSPSPRQILTSQQLEHITNTCKNLIFYSKQCAHQISASNYTDLDEIIDDAIEVSKNGDLPIVRRALRLLNEDIKIETDIEPVITKRIKKKLLRQEELKIKNVGKLQVNPGKVLVVFD